MSSLPSPPSSPPPPPPFPPDPPKHGPPHQSPLHASSSPSPAPPPHSIFSPPPSSFTTPSSHPASFSQTHISTQIPATTQSPLFSLPSGPSPSLPNAENWSPSSSLTSPTFTYATPFHLLVNPTPVVTSQSSLLSLIPAPSPTSSFLAGHPSQPGLNFNQCQSWYQQLHPQQQLVLWHQQQQAIWQQQQALHQHALHQQVLYQKALQQQAMAANQANTQLKHVVALQPSSSTRQLGSNPSGIVLQQGRAPLSLQTGNTQIQQTHPLDSAAVSSQASIQANLAGFPFSAESPSPVTGTVTLGSAPPATPAQPSPSRSLGLSHLLSL